jgi:sodium/potassium/calcium exchanger 6
MCMIAEDSLVSSSRASPRFMPLHYTPLDEDEILEITERSSPITLTASNPTRPDGRQRAHSVAGTGLGRRTKTRNTAVRPSLLGAIEFRDVVNSLAESSGANALSVFGNLDGPREGRQSSRYSVGGRSLSQLPDAALDHERPDSPRSERPTHRRAISTAGITPTRQSDFDPSIWDRSPRSSKSQVDLIDLSEGVENPWKSSPTAASPLLPRQLLKIDTHVGQSDAVSASPLPITPLPQQSKVIRKVPSIVLVNESGQATPVTLLSPPETPTGLRIPKWMVSSGRRRRKVRMVLTALRGALFPSLADFRKKSIVASFLALVSAPAILVLVITLPVVDEEADQEDACMDEKDIVVSHHTLTAGADEPVDDGRDEEERQGWQERARLRNEHIAHVMHSPAAFHHHSSDSYSRPLDLHSVDVELVRDQYFPDQDPPPEISIQSPQASRQYLLNGGPSPPASVRADLDQCAVDLKVGDALVLLQCALSPFFVVMALLGESLPSFFLLNADLWQATSWSSGTFWSRPASPWHCASSRRPSAGVLNGRARSSFALSASWSRWYGCCPVSMRWWACYK